VLRLRGIDEGEGERAHAELRGQVDGLPVRARHPERRVRFLHGLRDHVTDRHREILPLKARVGVEGHHVGHLLGGLAPHAAPLGGRDAEALELGARGGLPGAPLHAAVGDEIEGGQTLGDARRVIVAGRHQDDAVAEADPPRAL
jgi:hypothetical protein